MGNTAGEDDLSRSQRRVGGRLWRAVLAGCLLASGLVATVSAPPAGAHGVLDQAQQGDGGETPCSAAEFPGSTTLIDGRESRQSFVPSRGEIISLEVCIDRLIGLPGDDFTVNVYEGGTPSAPGQQLAAVGHDTGLDLLSPQWVHIDLDQAIPTTPGASYVIGLDPALGVLSNVTFRWRSSCAEGLTSSCEGVADRYPDGRTDDLPANADYAFRTHSEFAVDLAGAVTVDPLVCPGLDLTGRATGTIVNEAQTSVGAFEAQWSFSEDPTVDPGDRVLGAPLSIPGLAAGASVDVPPPTLPGDLQRGDGHLVLQIDPSGEVREVDVLDNAPVAPTTVTVCGQPSFQDVTVSVDEDEVPVGLGAVQFTDLDPAALATSPLSAQEVIDGPSIAANGFSANGFSANGFSANGFSANGFSANGFSANGFSANGFSANGFSANGFSANGFSANGFSGEYLSPAGGVRVADLLVDLPPGIADRVLVANTALTDDLLVTFDDLFDGPIQDATLADLVAALPDVRLEQVDLRTSLSLSWIATALSGAPAAQLGFDACAAISVAGAQCGVDGVDPTTQSLAHLEALGIRLHLSEAAAIPLTEADVSGALVRRFPLVGDASFSLSHTRLGQLPVARALVDPGVVAECEQVSCDATLSELEADGGLRDVQVGVLLDALSPEGRQTTTLGDLANGVTSRTALNLAAVNWNVGNVAHMDPECAAARWTVRGTNTGDGAAVDPVVEVTLPAGFAFRGGISLRVDGVPGVEQGVPSSSTSADGVRTYSFGLDAEIVDRFELGFDVCANVYTVTVDAGTATIRGEGIDGTYVASSPSTSTDRVTVVERSPGRTTEAIVGGSDGDLNVVVFGHLSEAGADDSFVLPADAVPGRLTVATLFPPPGFDQELIAYGPPVSANGFSANGFSANGFSANGFSANGFSANGFSANGFSANGFSANGFSANGFSANGFSTTLGTDVQAGLPIEELRPADSSGVAVSANRDDQVETIYTLAEFGDMGNRTYAVTGEKAGPYVMTLQSREPSGDPGPCAAPPWDLSDPHGSAPAEWSGAAGPRTLFVANRQVTTSAYPDDAAAGLAALHDLAARPDVRGIVLEVDHDPAVRSAYASWMADWCSPVVANMVASHIRSLVLDLRDRYPTIDTIVLAGGDPIIPDWRLKDTSPLANEAQYAAAVRKATGANDALVAGFAARTIPSADPYANEDPLPYGTTFAFPPSAGISRMVETPTDWIAQRDQFVAADGLLDPAKGLVTGYDGFVDGASAAAEVLREGGVPTELLSDEAASWTADDLRAAAFGTDAPDASGLNAHANHWAVLSDAGSENDDISEIVTSDELDIPVGGFVFSNGCHFGTAVSDLLNPAPDAEQARRMLDFDQAVAARQGIAVTNSGFGIFDTEVIGQGERLQVLFLEALQEEPTAALALARAKTQFLATSGVFDPYLYKTFTQVQMYGLGVLRMAGAPTERPTGDPVPAGSASVPVDVGGYAVSGDGSCELCYLLSQLEAGTAVTLRDESLDSTGNTSVSGYWSAPISTQVVTRPEGMLSAGVWIDDIESTTFEDLDPVITRLAVNRTDREREPQVAAPFPAIPARAVDVGPDSYVTLSHGISQPTRLVDGRVVADVTVHTGIDADLLFRPDTTVGCAPHFEDVVVAQPEDSPVIAFDVRFSDRCPVTRAKVLARTDTGEWLRQDMGSVGDGRWTGAVVLPPGASRIVDALLEADSGTDVSYYRFKGDPPVVRTRVVSGVDLALSPQPGPSGIYASAVAATILGQPGVTYTVYENDHVIGSFGSGEMFAVTGSGVHELEVVGDDGSAYANRIVLDLDGPAIVLRTPPPGSTYVAGSEVVLDVECIDVGTASTCSTRVNGVEYEDGDALPTGSAGRYVIEVTAQDLVGNTATLTRAYDVVSRYEVSNFLPPITAAPALNSVNRDANLVVKFEVFEGGAEISDPSVLGQRTWQAVQCRTLQPTGSPVVAAGTTPEYSSFFQFNTITPSTSGCYALRVTTVDGAERVAYFRVMNGPA